MLAGGSGTRLRPITHTSAKQLVPVANKPVLFYGLEAIRDAGITEVGIVVGDTEPAIRSAVGSGQAFGLEVTYIRQSAPLGLAHAVLVAREFLGEDDFVMYLGDNFIVGGITALVEEFRTARPDAHIMLTQVADPRQFGVAELDDDGPAHRPGGEAAAPEERSGPGRGVPVHARRTRGGREPGTVGARRAGDHRGHPVAGATTAARSPPRSSRGTGRTPATSRTCSRSTGWCWRASSGRWPAGGRGERAHRPGGRRSRGQGEPARGSSGRPSSARVPR